ncbi:hypothetical protein ACN27F_26195 [Solwaraspora sp. WMMB335]|uniref:hypothetical protein n=1 Tax=Solwaraspora sp. WMMB335 TaxID=3404118 RepID=UPI003B92584E
MEPRVVFEWSLLLWGSWIRLRMIGLDLAEPSADGAITKAPCDGDRSPRHHRHQRHHREPVRLAAAARHLRAGQPPAAA